MHPPAPAAPNVAFGKLPVINFPEGSEDKPNNFQLETVDGGLPESMPKTVKIYFIPQVGGKFLSLDKATQTAKKLSFTDPPEKISEEVYRFTNIINSTTLTINVFTGQFEYHYNYLGDQTLINPKGLPSENEAISLVKTFLEQIDKKTDEIDESEFKANYWKMAADKLVSAVAPSEADFIRINVFREKAGGEYPLMPPDPNFGLISFLLSGIEVQSKKIVEAKFVYFSYDKEKFGTYPTKTIEQAFEELKNKKYYLASFTGNKDKTIKIRKIYFAYFDPPSSAKFLQPLFVFQGDDNFYGYVSAVASEWTE